MSFDLVNLVAANPNYTSSENSVMVCLAWHADNKGECWPSIPYMNRWTCLSTGTIREALRDLVSCGCVTRELLSGKAYRFTLNETPIESHTPTKSGKGIPLPKTTPVEIGTPTKSVGTPLPNPVGVPLPILVPEQSYNVNIEPSHKNKSTPRWLEILTRDKRWSKVDLNGFADDVEAQYSDLDLVVEATTAYHWLNDKGKTRKGTGFKTFWLNWLKRAKADKVKSNDNPNIRARAPSAIDELAAY